MLCMLLNNSLLEDFLVTCLLPDVRVTLSKTFVVQIY